MPRGPRRRGWSLQMLGLWLRAGARGRAGQARDGVLVRHRLRAHQRLLQGRPDRAAPLVERALEPVKGLGPFTQVDVPIVGTDNFDFMLHGCRTWWPTRSQRSTARTTT